MIPYQTKAKIALAVTGLGLLANLAPHADARLRIGSGEIGFTATGRYTYTDRVNPRRGSPSDTIYSLIPTVTYTRDNSALKTRASLSTPITRYESESAYNSEDLRLSFTGDLPYVTSRRLSGNWNLSYFNGIRTDYYLNTQLDVDSFNADLRGEYRVFSKFSLRASASYHDSSNGSIFAERVSDTTITRYAIGIARNEILNRFGIYTDYRITQRETTGVTGDPIDDSDQSFVFGLRGQILPERLFPKLEADLNFGISSSSDLDGRGESRNRLTYDGNLGYPLTPKTHLALNLNRSLDLSADDRAVDSTRYNFSVQTNPTRALNIAAGLGYSKNEFLDGEDDRSDDVVSGNFSVGYSLQRHWSLRASYNTRSSSSNVNASDYSASTYSFSTTFTY